MATKLKNMKLTSVDLVRAGANQEADICLYKSADSPGTPDEPTEREKGLLKAFLDWMRGNPTEPHREPQEDLSKEEERYPDENRAEETLEFYIETLEDSFESILRDSKIDPRKKAAIMQQSLQEFAAAMEELIPELCGEAPKEEPKEEIEEYDEIEEAN